MTLDGLIAALQGHNVRAFLRCLRHGESTQDQEAYRWLFGSTRSRPKLFDSFADHPRVRTYETYDGQFIKNGKLDFTTAAGAYQIAIRFSPTYAHSCYLPDYPALGDSGFPLDP